MLIRILSWVRFFTAYPLYWKTAGNTRKTHDFFTEKKTGAMVGYRQKDIWYVKGSCYGIKE
jgi:hypothetical protein